MTADEFRRRVNYDVGAMFNRTKQKWCGECVVNDDRRMMLVSNLCNPINVCDTCGRLSECLYDDGLGIWTESFINFVEIARINDSCFNALSAQRMFYKVKSAAIEVVCCNDVVAIACNVL